MAISIKRNFGYKIWKKAEKIIPGGNSILSKRPIERYTGLTWPTYFKKSQGCNIWDLQNRNM